MKVSEAVERRISARAFLKDPVPREVIERVLTRAARAPSGGNLQPWIVTVLQDDTLEELLAQVSAKLEGEGPDVMELARKAGTIGYELLTRIGREIPRVYKGT